MGESDHVGVAPVPAPPRDDRGRLEAVSDVLAEVTARPLAERIPAFDAIHADLRAALAGIDDI